jgi:enterochelin esterase-like enzyme
MTHSKNLFKSNELNEFIDSYVRAKHQNEKDFLWNSIATPFIEKITADENNSLVTFLYRKSHSEISTKIYIDCNAVGLPLTPISELHPITETDLVYLTLKLPNQLRTVYSFLKLTDQTAIVETKDMAHTLYPYPEFTGELKKITDTVTRLHADAQVEVDSRNPQKIVYYDYHNPEICFFKESILELPNAISQPAYLSDIDLIKSERKKLSQEKRFFEYTVSFSDTCLNDLPDYQDKEESTDKPARSERAYWIYLPPNYDDKNVYLLFLFLDGSDYLNTIPIPSILERMIHDKEFPPCIAVFLEYSPLQRVLEYYGNERFTQFLAYDLMKILREQHHLSITDDPDLITIVGLSASGLAAIFSGLTYPHVFGNVVTQSAALWCRKLDDLKKWMDNYLLKNADTFFCVEAGIYENIPAECRFEDGFTQEISILEANKELVDYMHKKGIKANLHEFVGGHNYVCYRSIADRLKEVYEMRLDKMSKLSKKFSY